MPKYIQQNIRETDAKGFKNGVEHEVTVNNGQYHVNSTHWEDGREIQSSKSGTLDSADSGTKALIEKVKRDGQRMMD